MTIMNTTEVCRNIEKLWSQAANGPVTVLSAGQAVAIVLSPTEFARLTAGQRSAKAGFAKHLFPDVDKNVLLETNLNDIFAEYR